MTRRISRKAPELPSVRPSINASIPDACAMTIRLEKPTSVHACTRRKEKLRPVLTTGNAFHSIPKSQFLTSAPTPIPSNGQLRLPLLVPPVLPLFCVILRVYVHNTQQPQSRVRGLLLGNGNRIPRGGEQAYILSSCHSPGEVRLARLAPRGHILFVRVFFFRHWRGEFCAVCAPMPDTMKPCIYMCVLHMKQGLAIIVLIIPAIKN